MEYKYEKKTGLKYRKKNYKKKYLPGVFILLFFLLTDVSLAGKIYVVQYAYQADLKVYVTKYAYQADLLAYLDQYEYRAKGKDEIWFYTKYVYQADIKIYFVDESYQADLKVFFVDYEYQAKWQNTNKWMGRLKK